MAKKVKDNWYEDFFQGINCEVWEKATNETWTMQEVEFLEQELNMKQGQNLLDVFCGFGRHAIEFAKRGFNVTALDISKTYINALSEKIKLNKLPINTIQADILTVNLNQTFSGAICMGDSFGYFGFDKMKVFIEKVSASLEKGAKFIINYTMLAESILPSFKEDVHQAMCDSYLIGDITKNTYNTYDVDEGCIIIDILYSKNNKREDHIYKHYIYTLSEIKRLLKQCGLNIIATYNATSKTSFKFGDMVIYIVAEKM